MNRSSHEIEKKLIQSIIEGDYSAGNELPPERELAENFQVSRPTIRETLQRLGQSGWLTLRKGRAPLVNDYLKQGNAKTIVHFVQHYETIPNEFVHYFLDFRIALTPQYVKKALALNHPKVVAILSKVDELPDDAEAYTQFDWELQLKLAELSENPLFLWTLNSFQDAYIPIAREYFTHDYCRQASCQYYEQLLSIALNGDAKQGELLTKRVMEQSYNLWKSLSSNKRRKENET